MNKEKLTDWLGRQFYKTDDQLGVCCKLVCKHVGSSKGDVFQIMVPNNEKVVKVDDDELAIMANQIEGQVLEDAEGLGGVCKYQLLAYFSKASRPVSRLTFRVTGSEFDEDEDGFSEGPNQKGHMGQMMRHNEALTRIAVMGSNQALGLQNRTIARQQELIENMMDKHLQNIELTETLLSNQHVRDLETKAAAAKEERYEQLYQKGKVLIPVIANRIAGRKVLPEESDPMVETLKAFAESLSPGQA
ncbi:hypothetical protein LCGC14_1171940, partial [marine sediment metagenome]